MSRRRQKLLDRHRIGPSKIAPYMPGLRVRHESRLKTNLNYESTVRAWAEMNGATLGIFNDGHHWKFSFKDGRIAEWWPSSAKLVLNKKYHDGWHVHDYLQAIRVIGERFKLPTNGDPQTSAAPGPGTP